MLEWITGLIGGLLYPLFSIIFVIINLLQSVFYRLAGIGTIEFEGARMPNGEFLEGSIGSANDGGETSTGLIYYLLTSDLIKNLFMSILILALFLIIIFTAMAFIKNAYSAKQKNWQEIVGNAFKGLANFIFIPVCCLLGVWLSNILLLAINGATSTGGATQMSRKLFICCAYDANEYRNKKEITGKQIAATSETINGKTISVTYDGDLGDIQKLVLVCDDVDVKFDYDHDKKDVEYFANIVDTIYAQTSNDYANIHWWGSVERHYSLFNFNYLVLIVGGVFMLYVLVSVAYAMIKRMFILLMLFVISPAICAMYPLDEGSAVGNWKKEFIKYTISAYGAIAAMNLFFSILPIVENINIVAGTGAFLNDIFQLLIMTSGLFVVKEFMGTLSGWIGGDNALATGESLRKSATGAVKKYKEGTFKGASKVVGAFAKFKGYRKSGEGFWKATRSSFADTMLGEKDEKGNRKHDGLLNFVTGGVEKDVVGVIKTGKDSYKYGKEAVEKDKERALTKEFEDNTKANKKDFKAHVTTRWNDALDILDDNGNVVGINNIYGQTKTFIDNAKKAGLSDNEAKKLASQQLGLTLNDVEEYYEKGTKEKEKKDRKEAAAENAEAMRGQAEASAMFNNVETASVQVKASRLEVDAQNSVMEGLAGTTGANPALIAEMNRQVASGNFAKIPDAVLPTDSMTVADIDLLEKWNTEMDKIAGVNDKYRESLNKLQSVAESVASKLEGVDTELTNFKNDMKDATKTVDDLDKSADDLAKAMSQAVNEGKKKGSGGSTP